METAGCGSRAPCLRARSFLVSPVVPSCCHRRVRSAGWKRTASPQRWPNSRGARGEDLLAACSGDKSAREQKSSGSRAVPEAIEGSFRQTDRGEIEPGFVRRCPRFLHLLPLQSARVHPRAGCRRQLSRLRRGISLWRWRFDWRGGNRRSRRKVKCRAPPRRTRWARRGQRRRERWVWCCCRIQRERRPEGELYGGQNDPCHEKGRCQECASAWRDHPLCPVHGIPFKLTMSWSETRFHSNRVIF